MDLHPTMALYPRSLGKRAEPGQSAPNLQRLVDLSTWMMVLGTVRVVCMAADYVGAFVDATRVEPFSIRTLSRLSQEIHPIVALSAAWPLVLAIALRRTKWSQFLPAAAATFLVLSIGGMIDLSFRWGDAQGAGGVVGSFHLTRRAFVSPRLSDFALGTLGAIQLALELATALRAIVLIPAFRRTPEELLNRTDRARRARCGRIAIYTSVGFLFVVMPAGSIYRELLDNSTLVRNFILENDTVRSDWRRMRAAQRAQMTDDERRFNDFRYMIMASADEAQNGRFKEARERYQKVIEAIDSLPDDSQSQEIKSLEAQALNNLAWLEATCPEIDLRDQREAVRNARRATTIEPKSGNYWNTLGAACYRAGEWEDARNALIRSISLGNSGNSFDWFFLALVDQKTGQTQDARAWYDRAVLWYHQFAPRDAELYRFQVEAAQELGLAKPEAPAFLSSGNIAPASMGRSIHRFVRQRNHGDQPKSSEN